MVTCYMLHVVCRCKVRLFQGLTSHMIHMSHAIYMITKIKTRRHTVYDFM